MNIATITRAIGKAGLRLSKYAPTAMVAAGTVGLIGTAVVSSKKTLKLMETIEPHVVDLYQVATAAEKGVEGYTDKDALSDRVKLYTRIAVDVTKLYLPAIALGTASVALIAAGHGMLMKRYAVLGTAYAGLTQNYNELLEKHSGLVETLDDYSADKTEYRKGESFGSPYRVYWGPGATEWSRDEQLAHMTLVATQNYYNNVLQSRGYVFLNEIYDALGLPATPHGQIVGWLYNGDGDNFINIARDVDEEYMEHVNGLVTTWWLDFNVDGPIYQEL